MFTSIIREWQNALKDRWWGDCVLLKQSATKAPRHKDAQRSFIVRLGVLVTLWQEWIITINTQ